MNINSLNNSIASIQAGQLSGKKNEANGTASSNQIGSSHSNQLDGESSIDASAVDSGSTLDRLKNLPEIRADVVEAAKEKLDSGFYQSRQAAIQTAKTILS